MLLLPFLLVACLPEPAVVAESGWYAVEPQQTEWSCDAQGPANGVRGDGLVWIEVGESWRWADDLDALPCVFDGLTFSCEVFDTGVAYSQANNSDATVEWSARIDAAWVDGETVEGEVLAIYTCTGADCVDIAPEYGDQFSFPCTATTTWIAPFAGE